MLPLYIFSDNSGVALPWELYKVQNYLLRTKEGDLEGYSSNVILVRELKLGVVVLTNVLSHATSYSRPITNILIPAFQTVLSYIEPAPVVPSNWQNYLGMLHRIYLKEVTPLFL